MSRVVDTRVAEMRFDNKDFEQNVEQSISTLDRLKQALNFGDAGQSFNNISKAAAGVNLSGIGDAIDTVKEKFSALEIAGITALVNLTNKAVDAGAQMVKSLTLDQVTAGWDKYAEKTTAVQTIMAATKKEFSDEEKQMEYVNEQLDKLNWFTDETSYNLVDMVSNIGKFTNAGVKLDAAVTSMQGVATWAAISGSNANEASRAMYNLSQALGAGYVRLIDWKSIENANMATMEFKEMAIQAGLEVGTLKKEVDAFGDSMINAVDEVGDLLYADVSAEHFSETLTKGKWLTSDVLNRVLDMYGGFTNALNNAYNETGLETIELLKYTEDFEKGLLDLDKVVEETGIDSSRLRQIFTELTDPTYELGRRAFKAAQETKTFAEVIAYTKDAVSSGWMNTFEIIFGDYKQAKEMWSNLSEVFYEIFVTSGEARNEMLEAWAELGGRTAMLESVSNAYEAVVKVIETVKEAFHEVFPAKDSQEKGQALFDFTEKVREFTEKLILSDEAADKLKNAVTPLFEKIKSGFETVKGFGKELGGVLAPALDKILKSVKNTGPALEKLADIGKRIAAAVIEPFKSVPKTLWEDFKEGFAAIADGIAGVIDKFSEWADGVALVLKQSETLWTYYVNYIAKDVAKILASFITDFFSLTQAIESFQKGGGGITGIIQVISDKLVLISDTIFKIIEKVTGKDLTGVVETVRESIEKVTQVLQEIVAALPELVSFEKILQSYNEGGKGLSGVLNAIKETLGGICSYIISIIENITGADLSQFTEKLASGFEKAFDVVHGFSDYVGKVISGERNPFDDITGFIQEFKKHIEKILSGEENPFELLTTAVQKLFDKLSEIFPQFGSIDLSGFGGFFDKIKEKLKSATEVFQGFITFAQGLWSVVKGLASIVEPFAELIGRFLQLVGEKLVGAAEQMDKLDVAVIFDRIGAAFKSLFELLGRIKLKDVVDVLKGIGLTALALEISKFVSDIAAVVEKFTFGESASIFEDLAKSILMIAAAMAVLSLIDKDALEEGQQALAVIMLGIVGVMTILTKLEHGLTKAVNTTAIATSVVAIAGAAMILTLALKSLGELTNEVSFDQLVTAFLGLSGIIAELVGSLIILSTNIKTESLVGAAAILLAVARAVKKLSKVVEELSELKLFDLAKGLGGVAAILGSLYLFLKGMSGTDGLDLKQAASIFILASGLKAMAGAVETIGQIDIEQLTQGLVGVAAVLTEIALFSKYGAAEDKGGLLATAVAMIAVAGALAVLTPSIETFSEMNWEEIAKALVTLGVSLGEMTAALKLLSNPMTLAGAAAILVVAGAVRVLAPALEEFGGLEWEEIAKALVTLGGALAEMTAALILLSNPMTLVGAAAILALAAALQLFNPVILAFGEMEWEEIGKALAMLGGMFVVVGGAGLLLAPLTPIILALSAALLAIGAAALLTAEAFKVFVEAAKEGYDLLKEIFSDLVVLIMAVKEGIESAIDYIKQKIQDFIQIGSDILHGFAEGISNAATTVWNEITGFFTGIVDGVKMIFGVHSPSTVFADIGGNLMEGFAIGIDEKKGLVSDATGEMGDEAADGMEEAMSKLSEMLNMDVDFEPTITPVMDLDSLSEDADSISDLFDNEYPVNLTGVLQSVNGRIDGDAVKIDDEGIIDEIRSLKDELNDLGNAIHRIKVVMDSGALVGSMIDDIDRALGRREVLAGRGVY